MTVWQRKFTGGTTGIAKEGYGLSEMTAVWHFNLSALIRVMGGRKGSRFLNRTLFGTLGLRILRGLTRIKGPKLFGQGGKGRRASHSGAADHARVLARRGEGPGQ